jgi:hypothetical protein
VPLSAAEGGCVEEDRGAVGQLRTPVVWNGGRRDDMEAVRWERCVGEGSFIVKA